MSSCAQTRSGDLIRHDSASAVEFDKFVTFSNPALCQENENFGKFLSDLIVWNDEFEGRSGKVAAPPTVVASLGQIKFDKGPGGFVALVPAKGTWKGFSLVAISTFAPEGGDPPDFTLHLAAPIHAVSNRLQRDGFDIVAGGTKTLDDSHGAYSLSITLVADPKNPDVTLFNCGLG